MSESARELLERGWKFQYEPSTEFVGAYHPSGGSKSIIKMCRSVGFDRDELGQAIANWMNAGCPELKVQP